MGESRREEGGDVGVKTRGGVLVFDLAQGRGIELRELVMLLWNPRVFLISNES